MIVARPALSKVMLPLLIPTIVGALDVALHVPVDSDGGYAIFTAGSPTSLVMLAGFASC